MKTSIVLGVTAISALALLSGCGKSKQQIEADAAKSLQMRLQTLTAERMKDPGSAQFRDVRVNTTQTAICGQVNSKNGFGGYVGFRDFVTSETTFVTKPDGCGSTSVFAMPPEAGTACLAYLKVTEVDKTCE